MAITLIDTYNVAAAAGAEVCLLTCALIALWWGNSNTRANLRFHRGNSKSPKLVDAAKAVAVSPPTHGSAQFTSVHDSVSWRFHSQADQPAGERACEEEAASEPKADVDGKQLPPWRRTKPPASPSEGDPGLDFQAFLGRLEQHCDMALDGLCDQAMGEQGDSVLMVFERDCEILGQGALPATQPDAELPCPEVPEPEDEQDCDYDDLCDSALVDFELDLKLLCDVVPEPEGEQDRAYDQLYASHLADLEELNWCLLGEVELTACRQLSCASLHERLILRVRKAVADYMLWAI
mmetsp:Transcript_60017/g.161790  ORF Transcript_60017/g.161790 Transcript_60017/m.161790 type:complete len:293 (-) Transcript_60017:884-1762(-)